MANKKKWKCIECDGEELNCLININPNEDIVDDVKEHDWWVIRRPDWVQFQSVWCHDCDAEVFTHWIEESPMD